MRQLLQAVQLSRRDLKLYQELGERYAAAEQAQRGGAGLHVDRRDAADRIGEPRPAGRDPREAESLARRNAHWEQVARLRALEPTGLLEAGRRADSREAMGQGPRNAAQARKARPWPQLALTMSRTKCGRSGTKLAGSEGTNEAGDGSTAKRAGRHDTKNSPES